MIGRTSLALVVAPVAVLLFVVGADPAAASLAVLATGLVLFGCWRRSGRDVRLGGLGLLGAVVAAGLGGVGVAPTLVAGAAAVLAWDVATNAIDLRAQVGSGRSARAELTHAATSLLGIGAVTVATSLVYALAAGGRPAVALVLLLVAAVALLSASR